MKLITRRLAVVVLVGTKGHITRNLGPENRIVVTIPLADQTGPGGGR